jgi:hypothetical protein
MGRDQHQGSAIASQLVSRVKESAGFRSGRWGRDIHPAPGVTDRDRSLVAGLAAYASVAFLTRWFSTRTLTPFGVYCLVAGGLCIARFA